MTNSVANIIGLFYLASLLSLVVVSFAASQEQITTNLGNNCIKVDNDSSKIICVCNKTNCDELDFEWPKLSGEVRLIETTQAGLRFKVSQLASKQSTLDEIQSNESTGKVILKLESKRQLILGWGGAFTDAALFNIDQLSDDVAEKLLQSYFGARGLLYNFGRVPIAGSDFSLRPYSYDDSPQPDYKLTNWSLADEDLKLKIPILKRVLRIVESTGNSLKLFASPWSPPKWMKTNKDVRRGYLIDEDRVYRSYAEYLLKFYQAYRKHGLQFWGATLQNEPISAFLPTYYFNSLQLGNEQARKFVANYLGPALEANNYTKANFKLMLGDDNLGFINMQVPNVLEDKQVQKYVSGLAFHWYMSGLVPYDSLTELVNEIRDRIEFVIMSEACTGALPGMKHVDLGSWQRGQSYASDIMEDLKRETGAWIDWNLALDQSGGPNWANNLVDSPILVNKQHNSFYKQPMFYVLGHFSRFFRPDSVYTKLNLIGDNLNNDTELMFAAVQNNKTGHAVINVLNKSDRNYKHFEVVVQSRDKVLHQIKSVTVKPKSINTLIIKL